MIPLFYAVWNYNKEYFLQEAEEQRRKDRDNQLIQEMYDLEAKYLKELRKKKKNESQANSHQ